MTTAGGHGGNPRRIMRAFKLNEISFVDRPAQKPARSALMKRDQSPAGAGMENSTMTEAEIKKLQDDLKAAQEAATKASEDVAKANAKADRAGRVSELSDVEKAYFSNLPADKQDAFLAKDGAARKAEVEATKAENPVVYTTIDGVDIRKSDGPALLAMAKKNDENAKELAKARGAAEQVTFEKRAGDELGNLGGDIKHRAELLKAVDGIKDEAVRKGVLETLKSANAAASGAFKRQGTSMTKNEGEEPTDKAGAVEKLDELAKAEAAASKIGYSEAYSKVLGTPEGQKLYEQTV